MFFGHDKFAGVIERVVVGNLVYAVLNATRQTLEGAGYAVVSCTEPDQFFTVLQREKPDLALVDVSMPILEGDSVAWVAQRFHACPIVLYSAKAEAELKKLAKACGADGYICKTDDENKLIAEVMRFISK